VRIQSDPIPFSKEGKEKEDLRDGGTTREQDTKWYPGTPVILPGRKKNTQELIYPP
jgi:hypothetical protein